MSIDLDRELLYVGIEYFDMLKSISRPSYIKNIWNKIFGLNSIFDDSNVKEFGALVIQEMDRIGVETLILVRTAQQLSVVREIILRAETLTGIECKIVPTAFREDWALGYGAQFVKSYEDVIAITKGLSEVQVESW